MRSRQLFLAVTAYLLIFCGLLFGADEAAKSGSLTFFGWSDQHVQTNGDASHLGPAIDAMNGLPGMDYPVRIGGRVDQPAFVFGCGDITEWPTAAAKDSYAQMVNERLRFPSYDIVGNHDEGGKAPSETIKRWIIARHGSLSYTFEQGGVRFVAVFSKYDESLNNPAQPVTRDALEFLRSDLAKLDRATPVVVAMHLCFDAITNRDDLVDALGDANVILVLGGHYHKTKIDRYRDIHFLQLPSPAPNGPREFAVIRIGRERLIAVAYNYERRGWNEESGKILDVPIRGPR